MDLSLNIVDNIKPNRIFTNNETLSESSTLIPKYSTSYNSFPFPFSLTPSQELAVESCIKLLPEFKIIVIKGEAACGKYLVATEIFRRIDAVVEFFDLCELAKFTSREISNQDIVGYLESLLQKLNYRMDNSGTRKRDRSSPSSDEKELQFKRKSPGIIYIRHYNRVADVLTDCYSKLRFLLPLILKTFSERMPNDVRILMTTHGCILPEGLHWAVELNTNRKDMEYILTPFLSRRDLSDIEFQYILKISRTVPVGRILYCLKYALVMSKNNPILPKRAVLLPVESSILPKSQKFLTTEEEEELVDYNDESSTDIRSQDNLDNNILIESYRKALSKFSGSTVDIDKDVSKPIPEDDLVGVEDIIDEITTSILNPMRLDIPGISIKRGLLLCGPPGTGKTSIGRWLAHQIKGKFYHIGGEAGINGTLLVDTFQRTVYKANENAPSVVFVDDGDVLFDQGDVYRMLLTVLDGIETNKRNHTCVIITCNNLAKVPSSLLRGGRLEMTLITRLPDRDKIRIILDRSLIKTEKTLRDYDNDLADILLKHATKSFIFDLSGKMIGWNCADIHRCVNDVSRLIISNKGTNLLELFDRCIKQIREQYNLCGRCESTNLDNNIIESYIL